MTPLEKKALLARTLMEVKRTGCAVPKLLRRPLTTTQRLVLHSLRRATTKETL
jgi:hypothetical protein